MSSQATAARGARKLRFSRVKKNTFMGVKAAYRLDDVVDVYNEYEDTETSTATGTVVNDGDQVLVDQSNVEEVIIEAYDPAVPANPGEPVVTYDEANDYVEVDMTYFDSYEEYYDEESDLQYEVSDCGSSIGIRG